ncbi:hypothetical protein HO173_004946 [Letharia columbiana]|uniref:SH3 domain-containing protein n=1 Tax=Letharia columbiana TaxID=112416 RepID=A0A8H6FXL7_9LECA|nr:uncharacterized protein HO173_004946 [Letharia columbiana]KAF6236655.1 hypothetical protein HO173_004946 [Letharia columbiana]
MKLSLEGFKSTLSLITQTVILGKTIKDGSSRQGNGGQDRGSTVRRNISVLSSAVLSDRRLIEKLNAAEAKPKRSRPVETESKAYGEGSATEEGLASDDFEQEMKIAIAPCETFILLPESQGTGRSFWLLRAYHDMRHDPPASSAINASLPSSVTQTRANTHRPFGLLTDTSGSEPTINEKESPDQEIRLLLTEWTSTAQYLLQGYLDDAPIGNTAGLSSEEPSQERHRNKSTNQRSNTQTDTSRSESNMTTPSDGALEPPFLTFETWSYPASGRKSLTDCFSERGGGYVWRHEDQASRWYYVGEKMVLEYLIRHPDDAISSEGQKMRTVVSKQWIPKNILIKAGYEHTEYGEGSYSIPGKLTTQDVRSLHLFASERTEKLLPRLASTRPKKSQRQMVRAIWDFDALAPTDLNFKKGDVFEVDADRSLAWWQGYKDGASGRLPASYVGLLTTAASDAKQSPRRKCNVRALSDFHSADGSELSFQAGDIIEIEEDLYELRWKGYLNGRQGLVPAHRVLVTSPAPSSSSESQLSGLISESIRRTSEKVRKTAAGKGGVKRQ